MRILKQPVHLKTTIPVPVIVADAQRALKLDDKAALSTVRKDAEDKLSWLKSLNVKNFKKGRMEAHEAGISTLEQLLLDFDELNVVATTPTVRDGRKRALSTPAKEPAMS